MDRFTELSLFVEVAERGSLSAAAEALGLSNPAATRYLASLENRLQARLVERNTRRLYLTSEGREFLERARHVLAELREAEAAIHGSTLTLPFIFQDRAWLTWVQYQAARTALLSCWRQAQHLALRAVRTGIADGSMTDGADAWRWSTVRCGSVARFIALESQPSLAWALPLHDKAHRRRAHIAASARRQCAMEDACAGMCLTWCEVAGWTVEASYIPNGSPVDRHRLLGVGQARPHFWLFGSEGQYVARACETKLQVRAETARAAIEGLRQAVAQYRRSYPAERSLPTFAG